MVVRRRKAQHRASRAAQKAVEDPSDTPKREMDRILFTKAGLRLAYALKEGRFLSIKHLSKRSGLHYVYLHHILLPKLHKEGWLIYDPHGRDKEIVLTPKGMLHVKSLIEILELLQPRSPFQGTAHQ
jgi:predicted transcriptional regulator